MTKKNSHIKKASLRGDFLSCTLLFHIILFGLVFIASHSTAQVNPAKMKVWQDSLKVLGEQLYQRESDPVLLERNAVLVRTLVSALKEKSSFDYDFEGLDMVSAIRAPDRKFRIFSWNVPLSDGSYLYYGAIQTNTQDGSLKLTPLLDQTFEIKDPDKEMLATERWYGAQYYEIVSFSRGYLLLGWKGHTDKVTRKVIEPLTFDGNRYLLGGRVFPDDKTLARKIFSFTSTASMYLRYHEQEGRIVFDHLDVSDPSMAGDYQHYGPDLSFDAYKIKGEVLLLESNIDFQNPERGDESLFIDPSRPSGRKRSGF